MAEPSIHANHRKRMMKKYMENGIDVFSDHEVLEMLLFFSISRGDTNELAHRLCNHFGSLHAVLDASVDDLMQVKGIGAHSAQLISLTHDLLRRYRIGVQREEQSGVCLRTAELLGAYFTPQFAGVKNEQLIAAYLDNKGRVLRCEILGEGSTNKVRLDMRRLIANALSCRAAGVALAHNHPSGDTVPSKEDFDLTDYAERMLAGVDVQLVDHIIVAGERHASMNVLRGPLLMRRKY